MQNRNNQFNHFFINRIDNIAISVLYTKARIQSRKSQNPERKKMRREERDEMYCKDYQILNKNKFQSSLILLI